MTPAAGLAAPPAVPSRAVWFARVLAAFARREARAAAGYRVAFLVRGLAFGFSTLALAFMSRLVGATSNPHLAAYGGDYLAFAVVGFVVMDLQQVGVSNLSQRVRAAQVLGLMEADMAAPVPVWIVLGVAPVYELGLALFRSTLYLLVAGIAFGVTFPHANWGSVVVGVPLMMGAFVGLGLLSAAVTMIARRSNPVALLLASASLLLSGVAYPVSVLPPALRAVGRCLPLTHALEIVRGAFLRGAGLAELSGSMTALAVFAGVLVPSGLALFAFALRRARVDGSLTHY
ncbi:MAG: ABC transporter permease [Verrucomicrobiota bacterium]